MATWFIVRVELHKLIGVPEISPEKYQDLHQVMQGNGFVRQIRSDTGGQFHLPPAEYFFEGRDGMTAMGIRDYLVGVLHYLDVPPSIMVTETPSVAWSGLQPVSMASGLLSRI